LDFRLSIDYDLATQVRLLHFLLLLFFRTDPRKRQASSLKRFSLDAISKLLIAKKTKKILG
jgi:hypothetical protein